MTNYSNAFHFINVLHYYYCYYQYPHDIYIIFFIEMLTLTFKTRHFQVIFYFVIYPCSTHKRACMCLLLLLHLFQITLVWRIKILIGKLPRRNVHHKWNKSRSQYIIIRYFRCKAFIKQSSFIYNLLNQTISSTSVDYFQDSSIIIILLDPFISFDRIVILLE